jgi:hypothetical protein
MKALLLGIALVLSGLTIAVAEPTAAPTTNVPKPPIVTTQEWGSKAQPIPDSRKQIPKWITIHHAGVVWRNAQDPAEFVRNMQNWGQNRPKLEKPPRDTYWPDLAYHFLIAPDGKIYEGRQIQYEPETNTHYKVNGNIGVEMMGDFNAQRPSPAQVESCVRLVAWLSSEYNVDLEHVRTHRDAAPGQTDCPGRDFYRYMLDGQFKKWTQQVLDGKEPEIDLGDPLPPQGPGPTTLITDFKPASKPAEQGQ